MIPHLDTAVFTIETQTSQPDRVSLLRLQALARRMCGHYCYLEIGSHLGGTLLPHLLDPACDAAHSIDPRPQSQPDERGRRFDYEDNSTARMLGELATRVPPHRLECLVTWDRDASEVPPSSFGRKFDLVLIDGEHTNVAAFSDFFSIFPALQRDALVAFHDANLVLDAISNIERALRYMEVEYATVFLPDCVAVIGLRGAATFVRSDFAECVQNRQEYENYARQALRLEIAKNAE